MPINEWLTGALQAWGAAGVFLGMMLESACVPLPSEVILPFAGILASRGVMTFGAAVVLALAGQVVGSLLAYYLGRWGGRSVLYRYGKYIFFRQDRLDAAQRWFDRHGEITVFAARLLPGVRTFISLPAGITRMPLWRFLVFSLLGATPWTAFLVWAGVKVGKVWLDPAWHQYFRVVQAAVVAAVIGLAVWHMLGRWKRGRGRQRHGAANRVRISVQLDRR